MKPSSSVFKSGTRPSSLALTQTRGALNRIEQMIPGISFEMVPIASTGDIDRTTDLRESPANFFTRELDEKLLAGEIDLAVHSAKDLPDPVCEGIDWFWLPWREEPRDVLIFSRDWKEKFRELKDHGRTFPKDWKPVIGVSSARRAEYCARRFPGGIQKPIRGNIEERLAQLDKGRFDIIVMAAAALIRLGLEERIDEWIPREELEVPEGQGYLAVTFRAEDERMLALRSLFVKPVVFAGAGVGSRELCTLATLNALRRCDICLHDSLVDETLLHELPRDAKAIDIGKYWGTKSHQHSEAIQLICKYARQGRRVVLLKSDDPDIFGRLSEEIESLEKLKIPFRVIPGISALQSAITGTGMLLTLRDVPPGLVVLTPRIGQNTVTRRSAEMKNRLPVVCYMSIGTIKTVSNQLIEDGVAPDTPAALVFNAGGRNEQIIRTTVGKLPEYVPDSSVGKPCLIITGELTAHAYNTRLGALRGKKILLTCSEPLQQKAADCVHDYGGIPIQWPLIRLEPVSQGLEKISAISSYHWIVLTSPSSVRCLWELLGKAGIDLRTLPKIMVCGAGTADELRSLGLHADAVPESGYSAESLLEEAKEKVKACHRILRLRSDRAGSGLAKKLRELGAEVDDCILYKNERIRYESLPAFEVVFFASASAVNAFIEQWGPQPLTRKTLLTIGSPTARELEKHGLHPDVIARKSTVAGAISTLAEFTVSCMLTGRKEMT